MSELGPEKEGVYIMKKASNTCGLCVQFFDLCRKSGSDVGHGGGTGRQGELSQISILQQQPLGLQHTLMKLILLRGNSTKEFHPSNKCDMEEVLTS